MAAIKIENKNDLFVYLEFFLLRINRHGNAGSDFCCYRISVAMNCKCLGARFFFCVFNFELSPSELN